MIHTPVHASWLNQAEIVFSIVQKKILSPNDFATTAQLAATLLAFIDRYNHSAQPFNWKLTVVPGIGHDGAAMSVVAASLWFEGRLPSAAELGALSGRHAA